MTMSPAKARTGRARKKICIKCNIEQCIPDFYLISGDMDIDSIHEDICILCCLKRKEELTPSILMPVLNGTEFLFDSVSSIIAQTHPDWELLIGISECSEEQFVKIKNKINNDFPDVRIIVERIEAQNKTEHLNKLKELAHHNLICFIDVEDFWMPLKLEKQIKHIDDFDIIGTNAAYFGDKFGMIGLSVGKLRPEVFASKNPIMFSSVMIKKENFQYDEESDDYMLWSKLLEKRKTFYTVPEVLVMNRVHAGQ